MTHPCPAPKWKRVTPLVSARSSSSLARSFVILSLLAVFTVRFHTQVFFTIEPRKWQTHLRPEANAELIRNREQAVPSAGGDV